MLRRLSTFAIATVAASLVGSFMESRARARDRRRFAPSGELVEVQGRKVHVHLEGEGSTLVVLESGAGGWSAHWGELPASLRSRYRVLRYDRAGLGFSEEGPGPRNVWALASDVAALIETVRARSREDGDGGAEIERVIFVGHSLGGTIGLALAHAHTELISGWVFVDAFVPGFSDDCRACGLPDLAASGASLEVLAWLTRIGLVRTVANVVTVWPHDRSRGEAKLPRLPEDQLAAQMLWPEVQRTMKREMVDNDACESELAQLDLRVAGPARVLSARETIGAAQVPRGYDRDLHNRQWLRAQDRLLEACDSGEQTIVDGDHLLPLNQPEAVITAIDEVANALGDPAKVESTRPQA